MSTLERDAFRTSTDFDFFDELDLDEPDWEEPVFELDLDELDLDELDVEDFVDPDELGVEVLLFDDPDVLDPEDLLEVVGFSVVVGALPDFEPDDPLPWACAAGRQGDHRDHHHCGDDGRARGERGETENSSLRSRGTGRTSTTRLPPPGRSTILGPRPIDVVDHVRSPSA